MSPRPQPAAQEARPYAGPPEVVDHVDELLRVREVPLAPYFLDVNRAAQLTALFWDDAVEALRQDRSGRGLAFQIERLEERLRILDLEAERRGTAVHALWSAQDAIVDGTEQYDEEEPIGTALHDAELFERVEREAGEGPEFEIRWMAGDGDGKWPYILTLREIDGQGRRVHPDTRLLSFSALLPWRAALKAAREAIAKAEREAERVSRWRTLMAFRIAVAEQVREEHESLGYVGSYAERPGSANRLALPQEQRIFVEAALPTILMAERGEGGVRKSFTSVRDTVGTVLEDRTGEEWGATRLERVAGELGAFAKHHGEPGSPGGGRTLARYERFRDRVIVVATRAGIMEEPGTGEN